MPQEAADVMSRLLARPMTRWQFWSLNALAILVLVSVIVNSALFSANRALQTDIRANQQFINETVKLSRLNTELIQALANRAAQTNDEQIKQLLSSQGIQYSKNR